MGWLNPDSGRFGSVSALGALIVRMQTMGTTTTCRGEEPHLSIGSIKYATVGVSEQVYIPWIFG